MSIAVRSARTKPVKAIEQWKRDATGHQIPHDSARAAERLARTVQAQTRKAQAERCRTQKAFGHQPASCLWLVKRPLSVTVENGGTDNHQFQHQQHKVLEVDIDAEDSHPAHVPLRPALGRRGNTFYRFKHTILIDISIWS